MPSSTPSAMPRDGSSGVDGTFQVSTLPASSSNRQMSVKVPPESTPTRHRDMPFLVLHVTPTWMLVALLVSFQARYQAHRWRQALWATPRGRCLQTQFDH